MSEKWIRLPDGTRYLAQVRDTYEAPAEPRQPDVAKRTRQQHAEYLAIIDARHRVAVAFQIVCIGIAAAAARIAPDGDRLAA